LKEIYRPLRKIKIYVEPNGFPKKRETKPGENNTIFILLGDHWGEFVKAEIRWTG
jgi:hypothetical protein